MSYVSYSPSLTV